MKKYCIVLFFSLFCFNSYSQTVINSFPSPTFNSGDLAYDGEHLWIGGKNDNLIYQFSTVDGTVIKTIGTSIVSPYGLTFDGTDLWVADPDNDSIQKIDTLDGGIIETYASAKNLPSYLVGLAWDGDHIWGNDYGEFAGDFNSYLYDSTFAVNYTEGTTSGFSAIGQGPTGLAYGNGYLFSADSETDQIYVIDASTFSVLDSFPVVGGTHPNGLAWDGDYLWLANNQSDSIFQIDLSPLFASILDLGEESAKVSIYPNPSVDFINIVFETPQNPIFEMVDVNGRKVNPIINSESKSTYLMDVSHLENGFYSLSIFRDAIKTTHFILKE